MNRLELPKSILILPDYSLNSPHIVHQEEINKKIEKYLAEVERDCKTLQQRSEKLERFRDKVSKYIDAEGVIDPANHQKVSEILEDLFKKHRAAMYHINAAKGVPNTGLMNQSHYPPLNPEMYFFPYSIMIN